MERGIFMSRQEQIMVAIIEDFRAGRLTKKEASEILGVSEKTIQRKAKRLRENGIAGIKHGNCGNVPINKKEETFKQQVLSIVKEHYFDFNLSHALEMLAKHHGILLSYGTFYTWCRLAGISKGRKRRPSKARLMRERMANEGLMLQMDGSHHAWNGKDKWCLVALIDDATSDIPYGEFSPTETTVACMRVLRAVIESKGIPSIIYTDEAGWSGNGKRCYFSQFKRACEELGIRVISTSSPESKGRIERAWRTIQDRLVPELRLYKITTMNDANRYLQQTFLPTYWARENRVQARNETSRYKKLCDHINLDNIFCFKYPRTIGRDHTFTYERERYRITERGYGSLSGKTINVHEYTTGGMKAFFGHLELKIEKVVVPKRLWLKKSA